MRHRYPCPLRWADLDQLGHINNVRYVDYLQEARHALMGSCLEAAEVERVPGDGFVVVRHELTYLAPLMFGLAPVMVESWVSELRPASFTLDHEIFHEDAEGVRTVYLRARTVVAPYRHDLGRLRRITAEERQALAPYAAEGPRSLPVSVDVPHDDRAAHYPVHVRFSDMDVNQHVNNVKYVEYFQEARIALFLKLRPALKGFPRINVVVAQLDIEYLSAAVGRPDHYDCWSTVARMGTKSMVIDSEMVDPAAGAGRGAVVARARAVLVFFDAVTQTSVAPPPGYREAIAEVLGLPG